MRPLIDNRAISRSIEKRFDHLLHLTEEGIVLYWIPAASAKRICGGQGAACLRTDDQRGNHEKAILMIIRQKVDRRYRWLFLTIKVLSV